MKSEDTEHATPNTHLRWLKVGKDGVTQGDAV